MPLGENFLGVEVVDRELELAEHLLDTPPVSRESIAARLVNRPDVGRQLAGCAARSGRLKAVLTNTSPIALGRRLARGALLAFRPRAARSSPGRARLGSRSSSLRSRLVDRATTPHKSGRNYSADGPDHFG